MSRALLCLLLLGCASTPRAPETPPHAVVAIGIRPMPVLGMHMGIWQDVQRCLGVRARAPVTWFSAARLVRGDGVLVYGLTQIHPTSPVIILERAYWLHPAVISHEAVHAITGSMEEPTRCVLDIPGALPIRTLPQDSVDHYRAMARGQG
jgi:hypothetical protein